MMSVCLITQPRLFPGLHYLHRILIADVFVVLDIVQFTPRHEENRTKLKAPDGPRWLTIPMLRGSREQPILETRIDQTQHWRRKSLNTLDALYGGAARYADFREEVRAVFEEPQETLVDVTTASWRTAFRLLEPTCEILRASDLSVAGSGPELLLDICRAVGADTYLSGAFGREYLDERQFEQAGIGVLYHEYECRAYPQRFGDFVPFLSYLDHLFNVGLDRAAVEAGASEGGRGDATSGPGRTDSADGTGSA